MSFARKFACAMSLCATIALVAGCTDSGAAPKKTEPAKPAGGAKAPEAGSSTGGGTKVPEKK